MIAKLTGRVDSTTADSAVIDVGGVGYLVFASSRTLAALAKAGGIVSLRIETHVREDHIHLYGFADEAEQAAFKLLTTVQGVGARLALAILSVLPAAGLSQSIAAGDRAALTKAPGVGPKLATRILTELKDKVAGLGPLPGAKIVAMPGASAAAEGGSPAAADAVSALVNLGYGRTEAFAAVSRAVQARGGEAAVEILIREGLSELAKGDARV